MTQKGNFVPLTPQAARKPSTTQTNAESAIKEFALGLRLASARIPKVIISKPHIMIARSKIRHTALFTAVALMAPATGKPKEM